jgi:hypothetical protein
VITLCRYLWSDLIRSHRWVAPLVIYVAVEAISSATAGAVLPTYSAVSVAVLFLAIWIAVIVSKSEDPLQSYVTAVTAHGVAKTRLSKLFVAFQVATLLGLLGLAAPAIITSAPVDTSAVVAGALAVVATSGAGVAIGGICSRPIVKRTSWALLLGLSAGMATILIPHAPPTRQVLVLFSASHPNLGPTLGLILAETVLLSTLLVVSSLRIAWKRT